MNMNSRWINFAVIFGADIRDVFTIGLGNVTESMPDISPEDVTHLRAAFTNILDLIPGVRNVLPAAQGHEVGIFRKVVDSIQSRCHSSRAETTRRINSNLIHYLTAGPVPIQCSRLDKHASPLNHPELGRLIIPARYLRDWDWDPNTVKNDLLTGKLKITAAKMPVILYEEYQYDPADPEKGLFRSSFLICVFVDIAFGPQAVDIASASRNVHRPRYRCLATMYNFFSVKPAMIAYAAVVARFVISMKQTWTMKDDSFDYHEFYIEVIERLIDADDPWVQDLFAWWNVKIFGNELGKLTWPIPDEDDQEEREAFQDRRYRRKVAMGRRLGISVTNTGSQVEVAHPDE
ncbi:hypothetical protein V8E53_013479 [Lactarius tabidus]